MKYTIPTDTSNIFDLTEDEGYFYSNVTSRIHRLPNVVVWFGPNHLIADPKIIKVCNNPDVSIFTDCFLIYLNGMRIEGQINQEIFTPDLLDKLFSWITENMNVILRHIAGEIDTAELYEGLLK